MTATFDRNYPYPHNAWYAVAWDVEVTKNLRARTICERPLVMYRKSDGAAIVLEDACWRRLLPLSKDWLREDNLVCGYHGLVFNPDGRGVHMPSQDTINPAANVRSYPVMEKHHFVWVWMGDPATADPAKVPDLHWNDDPEWTGGGKVIHLQCDYRLVVDNLMDLTHETFVHAGSIGNQAVTEAPFDVTHTEKTATVTRWMINSDPPPFDEI